MEWGIAAIIVLLGLIYWRLRDISSRASAHDAELRKAMDEAADAGWEAEQCRKLEQAEKKRLERWQNSPEFQAMQKRMRRGDKIASLRRYYENKN